MASLLDAEQIPAKVRGLCTELQRHGHRSWVVGGCLRDLLRDTPASDWDLATSARPDQVLQAFRRVIPTGIQHGTVTVVYKGESFEVTTLRGEGAYSDGRRPDSVEFVDDIEADLARRDFTVNAIAYDPLTNTVVDPFHGVRDLQDGVLRAVGDARERFSEDGLRVLRAARFVAKLEFELEPATEAAIEPTLDTFRQVSAERVRDEWVKALVAREPSRAFEVMKRTGILAVTLPELSDLDAERWRAALAAVDAPGEPVWRLAGLLHPLAQAQSERLASWLNDYRYSNAEQKRVRHLLEHFPLSYARHERDADVRRLAQRVGVDSLADVLALGRSVAEADGRDGDVASVDALVERVNALVDDRTVLSIKQLAVDGKGLMDALELSPGPVLGKLLAHLLERVMDEPQLNQRETLLELSRTYLSSEESGA